MSHLADVGRAAFDLRLYPEVQRQRLRRTVAHLVTLVALATMGATIVVALHVRGLVTRILPELDKLPTITIKNGEASADVEQPWVKRVGRDASGKEIVLIIDTTGTLDGFRDDQAGLFLQRRHLLVKGTEGPTRAFSLKHVRDRTLGPQKLRAWALRARWLLPLAFAVISFVYFWIAKGMQALVLSLIGLIAGSRRRRPLGFPALFSIAVYALGPPVALDVALLLFPFKLPFPFGALLYAGLAIGLTVAAVQSTPDEPQLTLV